MLLSQRVIRIGLLMSAVLAIGPAVRSQMKAVGPLDQFGFPSTFTDFDDTVLVHGTDVADPFLLAGAELGALPDPSGPLDVATGNFFPETFWWLGETDMTTGLGNAQLVMALEGIWQNEIVVPGDQAAMARLRIRVDLDTAGHFVVTHPYGVDEFDVSAADVGIRAINFTIDSISGLGPGTEFTTPLDPALTRIGPTVLRWDAGAPAGYLGNPNVPHTITGSPFGTNFFRIEGPNVGGAGIDSIQTDLFGIVGKLQAVVPGSAFVSLDNSLAGTGGESPVLSGTGTLDGGTPFTLDLTNGVVGTTGLFLASPAVGNTAFFGGTLVPDIGNLLFRRPVGTNGLGEFHIGGTFPAGVPAGTEFIFQVWLSDTGAIQGVSASNGLMATTP